MNNFTKEELKKEEQLFVIIGLLYPGDTWGMSLRSSNDLIDKISCILDKSVPPYPCHTFLRNDIIKIRNYLNEYLERTEINGNE